MAAWLIWTAGLFAAAAGLALAAWALLWDRPRGRRRCPRCWYDLASAPVPATCPECGRVIRRERALRRTRRRWGLAAAGVVIAGAAGWATPLGATRGWPAAVPAMLLRPLIATCFEERAMESYSDAIASGRVPASAWEQHLAAWAASRAPPRPVDPEETMVNIQVLLGQYVTMCGLAETPAMRLAGPEWQEALDFHQTLERLRDYEIGSEARQR